MCNVTSTSESPGVGFEPTTNGLTVKSLPKRPDKAQQATDRNDITIKSLVFFCFCDDLLLSAIRCDQVGIIWGKIGDRLRVS